MKNTIYISYLTLLFIAFYGCGNIVAEEKNLTQASVQKKEVNTLQEKIEYTFPANAKETIRIDTTNAEIIIDAQVINTLTDEVKSVDIEKVKYTDEDGEKIIKIFFGKNEVYEIKTKEDFTKMEIEEEIIRLKQGKSSDLAQVDKQAYLEFIKPDIEFWEKRYQSAKDEYFPVVSDKKFKEINPYKNDPVAQAYFDEQAIEVDFGESIELQGMAFDGKESKLTIFRNENYCGYDFISKRENNEEIPGIGVRTDIETAQNLPKITVENAIELAEKFIDDKGFENYNLIGQAATIAGYDMDYTSYDTIKKCYVLYFAKDYGTPINYVSNQLENEFNELYPYELLSICVDDLGILGVSYTSPSKITGEKYLGEKLLEFENVYDKFKTTLTHGSMWQRPEIEKQIIYIDKIQIGLGRVIKDNNYEYVPVWDFYGRVYLKYKDDDTANSEVTTRDYNLSIMTINALDGSIVNRYTRY